VALGAAIALAGGFIVVRSLFGGSADALTGPATVIPSGVSTAAPTPMAKPTAAALAASTPMRIEIPSINVDAPVMKLGLNTNGSVQVPPLGNHNLTGWYDHSVTPGQKGTSVILGHVDSFQGTSVFFYIKTLKPGDMVKVVRADGSTATFMVDGVQKVVKATFASSIIYGNTKFPSLRLITCGGPFDTTTRQYLDNIVVYTHLVSGSGT
jgi:LPXTG-site transpeptidase (sortase) family protein